MKDYTKTAIRLKKVHERGLKKSYKHLSTQEYTLVKKAERYLQAEKEMYYNDLRYPYGSDLNWRKEPWGQLLLQQFFTSYAALERAAGKAGKSVDDVLLLAKAVPTCSHLYGGSF